MSYAETCGWTLLNAVLVAGSCVPLCAGLHELLLGLSSRGRRVLWVLLLVPLFTPTLLTGYAYANFSLSLLHAPVLNRLLYLVLLGLKFLAVGTMVLHFAPPAPATEAAVHCARLLRQGKRRMPMWPVLLQSSLRNLFPCFAILFLLVFQEFELSSLMVTDTWTVWLFDAQALGMNRRDSFLRAAWPAFLQALVVIGLLAFSYRQRAVPTSSLPRAARLHLVLRIGCWCLAGTASLMVTILPFGYVCQSAWLGLQAVLADKHIHGEVLTALIYGLTSGIAASWLATLLLQFQRSTVHSGWQRMATVSLGVFALPGLLGSLLVSLAVQWLFQLPGLNVAYDSRLPTIVALFLFLLPRALIVQVALAASGSQAELHLAELLRHRATSQRSRVGDLLWELKYQRMFLVAAMLCLWGYFELTPMAILSPPGVNAAPVRLYNQMHFGRGMIVSGLLLVSILVPGSLFLLVLQVRRWFVFDWRSSAESGTI